jgi:hypothetical protein
MAKKVSDRKGAEKKDETKRAPIAVAVLQRKASALRQREPQCAA